jgi:hypothetical protein
VRVRVLGLRLIAVGLAGLWAATAAGLLVAYRPGGPADVLLGVAALVPLVVALCGVAWPPGARGALTFRAIAGLGFGTAIILLGSLLALAADLGEQGRPALIPSPEAAYPWALAILGTSFFAGLGIAQRVRGPASGRSGRLGLAVAVGTGLSVMSAGVLAAATIANELALRDRPAVASPFGPTDAALVPPRCVAEITAGPTATLTLALGGHVDNRPLGTVSIRGARAGAEFRWQASVATARAVGLGGAALVGERGWIRDPVTRWEEVPAADLAGEALDLAVVEEALGAEVLAAAEDLGLGRVEGAPARRCRVAIGGTVFREAFPQVRWLVGGTDLDVWRGDLDVWVFADGQLGRVEARLEGPGFHLEEGALRAELTAVLDATYRGQPVEVVPPTE